MLWTTRGGTNVVVPAPAAAGAIGEDSALADEAVEADADLGELTGTAIGGIGPKISSQEYQMPSFLRGGIGGKDM